MNHLNIQNDLKGHAPGVWNLLRLPLLFAVLLFSGTNTNGQAFVSTGTATAAGGNTIPFGNTSNKIEMTYSASDFTAAPTPGYITKIYLRFTTSGSSTLSNFSIAMTQVAASSITTSTTFTTGLTTVYGPASTKITPTKSVWYPITLSKAFYYDPSKVLVVTMQHNGYTTTNSIGTVTVSGGALKRYRLYGTYGSTTGTGSGLQKCDFGFDLGSYGTNNAGVTSLVSPVNFCASSTAQTISVKVTNFGTNAINPVSVGWSFDGTTQTAVKYSSSIASLGSATITLGSQVFASGISHTLKAWTFSPNSATDTVPKDDSLRISSLLPALSGTFTIDPAGSGSSNFKTFAAAVSALNTSGVCGSVTFNVAAGTFSETVAIGAIAGASSTNTVTFVGVSRTKTILTSTGATLSIGASSYVTFNQMTIQSTGSSSTAVTFTASKYCSVINSNIMGALGGSTYNIYLTNGTFGCKFDNNNISGNDYGFYFNGTLGTAAAPAGSLIFSNNRITQFGDYGTFAYSSSTYGAVGNVYSGNVIDSSYYGYGLGMLSEEESGAIYKNNRVIAPGLYEPIELDEPNYYLSTTPFQVVNNFFSNFTDYVYVYMYNASNVLIAHNTIYGSINSYCVYFDIESCISNINIVSNIFYGGGGNPVVYYYTYGGTFPSPFGIIDGNDYFNPSGGPLTMDPIGNTYSDLASYKTAMSAYSYTSPYNGVVNAIETYAVNVNPNFIKTPNDLHIDQTKTAPSGAYAGVDFDIDGDARCKIFPTIGADESTFGKSKPIVKFFIPAKVFPGSPTYIYQTAKAGEPKAHQWYLNGVKVSDSVVLFTTKFVTGSNTLKLVTQSCGGNDSFEQTFNVAAPTAVPGTDFIANKNSVRQGDYVMFQDLSSNGPTKWQWTITPDSVVSGGARVPSGKFIFGDANFQNPWVRFDYGGKYKICMTATNGIGKGATVCKTNYITVVPSVNLATGTQVARDPSGYLYDNGGPNGVYNYDPANNYIESILIDPCADSVYLTFSMFDTYCGYDYVRMFSGSDNSGTPLWSAKCTGTGWDNTGPGYDGGPTYSCSFDCLPGVVKPDTFKAAKTMYIEMVCYAGGAGGFAAHWWSKPKSATKPKASFVSSNAGDSVCTNALLTFTNTTKIDKNDPASFLWDLDGDFSSGFECIGTCATASYPYFLSGKQTVTLVALNCGGSDTAIRNITIFNPKKPVSAFSADNTSPTTNDIVFFSSEVVQCVDDYKWTITPVAPTTGKAVYVNGTSNLSSNPQVNFTGKGYYDVELFVDNASGAQNSDLVKSKYILVRDAYCIPSVAVYNQGIGISHVVFNTIDNKTVQAATEYSNFTVLPGMGTTVAIGASYNITISRDPSLLFEPINRSVFIDWNGDGSFTGAGELAASDSNTYTQDFTKKITIPKTAKLGATVMRIATNRGTYSNKPCGQNEFGEYQDYRLYITPYNILPVITLKGQQGLNDTIKIEQGNPFVEPGYSASSFLYGNMTSAVSVTTKLNVVIPGVYLISYNVSDSTLPVANKAITKYRVVEVTKDMTPPVLIVDKPDTTLVPVTKLPMHPVPVPKVTSADDLVDGPLASSVTIDSAKVQTNIVGIYVVSYTITDLSGNTATVNRVIKVIDTVRPSMKLIGASPVTLEVYNSYIEQGVTTSDNYYSSGKLGQLVLTTGNVDTSTLGTYTITYTLTDPSGNQAASITRTVIVVDTIPPVISIIGKPTDSVAVFNPYKDKGVTVSDNYDNEVSVKITRTGTFYSTFPGGTNPNVTGSYTIVYTATDRSGNKASVTRIVKVQDRTAPVIALAGPSAVSVCRWFPYVDARFTVSDNYDKLTDIKIDSEGTFYSRGGTTMTDLLFLRYKAADKAGNTSYTDYRFIKVKSETDFTCLSIVAPGIELDKNINVYPNPNTGIFTISADLPVQEKIRMSITNMLGQEIAVVHNGILGHNNLQVDLSNQPGGIYLLNIVSENQTITKRIEITR